MSGLTETLDRVLGVEGVRVAALVDVGSGMVVTSAGDAGSDFPAAAASLADEARAAFRALTLGRPGGDVTEISLVTSDRFQLSRVLDSRPGEGLLLFVELDRARTNLALAGLQIDQAAAGVLA